MKLIVATLLAIVVGFSSAVAEESNNVAHGDKTVGKVVKMLKDMLKNGKKDADKDREVYAKFKCYCDDNEAKKTENIEDNEKSIKKLGSSVAELRAANGKLSMECGQLKSDIEENEAAREEAEGIRKKAEEDFKETEKDLSSAIKSMEEALDVLAEVGEDQKKTDLLTVDSTSSNFLGKSSLLLLKSNLKSARQAAEVHLTQKQQRIFDSFIQAPFTGTYQSQSGEIVGILKNMVDTFKANLEQAEDAEKSSKESHEKFMKTKNEAYDTMKESYDDKQSILGENDETLSGDLETLEEAETELKEDTEFLSKLRPMCEEKEKQFNERKMMRANEEAAVAQAIGILDSDSAADTFKKTKKKELLQIPSFMQIASHNQDLADSSTRQTVQAELQAQARQMKSLKLARAAAMLELGNPFTDVLAEIEKMLKLLDEEAKADEEQKEWCLTEREENEDLKSETEEKIESLENRIDELDMAINKPEEGLKDSIKQAEKDVVTNREAQQEETAARSEENQAYQEAIGNFLAAQKILTKAVTVLKQFYDSMKKKELLLVQKEDPKPPKAFEDDYEGQSDKGNDVIKMIEFILEESKEEEGEAHKDEEKAQHSYEDSMTELTKEQAELEESIAKMGVELAETKKSLAEARDDLTVTEKALKEVERYLKKIKPGCDFMVDNFDERKKNRGKEKKALKMAVKKLKGTPAFKKAELAAEQESWAKKGCKEVCMEDKEHAKCQACLNGVSVPGYCVTHKDTPGC